MITMTAASTRGPTSSRAKDSPASAITAAASPSSTRSVGESAGAGAAGGWAGRFAMSHAAHRTLWRGGCLRSVSRAFGIDALGSLSQLLGQLAHIRATGGHGVVVAARGALHDERRDGRDDKADHDDAARHEEHRRDAPGHGHRHIVAVADGRHGAERPPDRYAERRDRGTGRVPLGLQDEQRDVPHQQQRRPDAVDQQARPDGVARGPRERCESRECVEQPDRPEGRDEREQEIELVRPEPQSSRTRQTQQHEVVDDEDHPDQPDRRRRDDAPHPLDIADDMHGVGQQEHGRGDRERPVGELLPAFSARVLALRCRGLGCGGHVCTLEADDPGAAPTR